MKRSHLINGVSGRRRFLQLAAASSAASIGDFGFLARLPRVSAEEAARVVAVRLDPSIEPLVRLLEDTPQDRLLEEVGYRVRNGSAGYREVLAALQLAGVRNIQPRPVGFKFHAVLVVNSAHLASLSSPDRDRWLPIFWALDHFKNSQQRDVEQGDWTMGGVEENAVPPVHRAVPAYQEAMDRWDEAGADAATASLVRGVGAQQVFDLLARYGARDFRDIGHKIIYVANAWRTLQTIGWEHAEPILRSISYALLMHEGNNPADRDAEVDRPWRLHVAKAAAIPKEWQAGRRDAAAAASFLGMLRQCSWEEAGDETVRLLTAGIGPESVWDALFSASGELLMRRPGILSLHAVTSMNALHYAYRQSYQEDTRKMLLLQAAAFLPFFRQDPAALADQTERIDGLAPWENLPEGSEGLSETLSAITGNRYEAARRVLTWCERGGSEGVEEFIRGARRLLFLKGSNAHDYKFTSAVLEDYAALAPGIRERFLASSVYNLRGSDERDNPLVERIRAAVG